MLKTLTLVSKYVMDKSGKLWILSNMKETFRIDYNFFWSDKTDKSLTCCIYKNDIVT